MAREVMKKNQKSLKELKRLPRSSRSRGTTARQGSVEGLLPLQGLRRAKESWSHSCRSRRRGYSYYFSGIALAASARIFARRVNGASSP